MMPRVINARGGRGIVERACVLMVISYFAP